MSIMWHYNFIIIIIVLCSIQALCATTDDDGDVDDEFLCQLFDNSTQSFAYYCRDFIQFRSVDVETETYVYIKDCSFDKDTELEFASQVFHLEIGGCANETVRDIVDRFNSTARTMNVSYSGYKTMDSLNFVHNQLQEINLSHNQITEQPWSHHLSFYERFPMLRELDLSYNKLHAVHLITNRSINIQLESLHLQHNAIAFIQSGAFVNLTRLKYINLSHNRLDRVSANAFSNLQALQTLRIEQNPIDFFFCDDLLHMRFIWVYMSWDHIEYFSTDCDGIAPPESSWLDTQYIVAFNTSKHGFFPMSEVRYKIDCDPNTFERIRTFKAGRNKYLTVLAILQCFGSTLVELDLSGNFIGIIEPTTFERFVNLYELSLRDTQLLSFDFQMLQQQHHLIALDISENRLTNINNILMAWNLRDLQEFIAAGNRFKADLLKQLPSTIKYLDLSETVLGELNPKYFEYLTSLEELRLRQTGLSFSGVNPFEALENLHLLDVSHNDLRGMDFTQIESTLDQLREFRAAGCNISNAAELIRLFGLNLWTLDLSGNSVGDLDEDSPLHRLNLLNLYLNHANISKFDLKTLKESGSLAYFEIANNHLKEIDLMPLAGPYLVELNIKGNKLIVVRNLHPSLFPKLRSLNVAQNQLSCENSVQLTHHWTHQLADFEHSHMSSVNCTELDED